MRKSNLKLTTPAIIGDAPAAGDPARTAAQEVVDEIRSFMGDRGVKTCEVGALLHGILAKFDGVGIVPTVSLDPLPVAPTPEPR